jgi:hypothetical protein
MQDLDRQLPGRNKGFHGNTYFRGVSEANFFVECLLQVKRVHEELVRALRLASPLRAEA